MSAATRWTLVIVGLLVGNLAAMAALIVSSSTNRPQLIPAYYDRAVAYNDELDDAERSRRLGWQATASILDGRLDVKMRDASGALLRDARIHVVGVSRARAAARFDIALDANGRSSEQLGSTGVYDLEVSATRGGDRFVARIVVEAR